MITASEQKLEAVRALLAAMTSDGATETTLTAIEALLTGTLSTNVQSVSIPPTFVHGHKTVDVAGVDEVLGASSGLVIGVTIKALSSNGGLIYVGVENVNNANGYELASGEQIFIPVGDIASVWIDTDNNGDTVSFIGN